MIDQLDPNSDSEKTKPQHPATPIEPPFFELTEAAPPPYLVYAYGTLPPTQRAAIHFFRIRPYLGELDPVLQTGLRDRVSFLRRIQEGERRAENRELWKHLLSPPFTHVIKIGWVSRATGLKFKILYLPLRFSYHGISSTYLAEECGAFLIERLQRQEKIFVLCPPPHSVDAISMFWLTMLFVHYRGSTVDQISTGSR